MRTTGHTVSRQISQAYSIAQQELAEARAVASTVDQAIQALSGDREHTLADLAKHYLPNLTRESLMQTWSEARTSIEQILLRKEGHMSKLDRDMNDLDSQKQAAEEDLEAESQKLDALLKRQQEVSEALSQVLISNQTFIELTARAAEADAALERAEASLEQIEHDASQKLPAYENSKLFMYLHRRGLATPKYTARGLTRRLDRWVGRLIDYPKAKIGYEYLMTTPGQVRNLVAQDRDALAVVMGELERQRDEEAAKLGLPSIVAQVADADAQRNATLQRLDQIRAETDAMRNELAKLENSEGPYYQEAIDYFKTLLERTERGTLEDRARRTPDPRDDHIVARLKQLDSEAGEVKSEAVRRQQRIEWLDRHLGELGSFQQRFRRERFDSSQSEFDGAIDLVQELAMVREGRDTIDHVWSRVRARHRFAPTALENAGTGLANVARHPLTQVLVHAMATAAAQSMTDHARRAGGRHINTHRNQHSSRSSSGGYAQPSAPRTPKPNNNSGGGGFITSQKF
jgi:hypothetical protein